ncbi:hypothetical protein PP358_gp19 [Arthrobacter phage Shoya]|uniref:Uncharacterized protein n=1 Tax=Arthrobacter phage Shoya TaxID=2704035 RepID=A0A6G6XIV3_9CAUD|nr:hypothetical protein PP358_gp19 [Arthrobacter phage Shoya]QIG57690.1 hypothetical protein SEA_SHOYA_19 [Arthrobacter phage Shoya]
MDLQWLVPLGGFLTVVGGGIAWLVNRADKRRDAREAQVIQTLKDRVAELLKKVQWWERRDDRRTRTGDKWREQLIENHIKPEPSEWPEDPPSE